jgi:hypothetical protein
MSTERYGITTGTSFIAASVSRQKWRFVQGFPAYDYLIPTHLYQKFTRLYALGHRNGYREFFEQFDKYKAKKMFYYTFENPEG